MPALGRQVAIGQMVVDDVDVRAERSKRVTIQRMALEWTPVGSATPMNAPFTKEDTCRRPVFANGIGFLHSGVCRNDQSAIHQRFFNEGSLFPLLYPFHFSRAEVLCHFVWRLRVGFPTWACHVLNGAMAFRSYSRSAPARRFALPIPFFL